MVLVNSLHHSTTKPKTRLVSNPASLSNHKYSMDFKATQPTSGITPSKKVTISVDFLMTYVYQPYHVLGAILYNS